MKKQFPIAQFKLALQDTSTIKAHLKPFITEFKSNNMFFITQTVQQLHKYLTDKNIEIQVAFNSLFAIKVIVDKADYIISSMIEAYLLPKILEIASFELNKQNKSRGDSYFISKGFKGQRSLLQYYGFNFIRIACEFIMASSQIKPNRLVYNQEIKDPSEFALSYRKLKLKGFKPYENFVFYKEKSIKEARARFLSNLGNYYKVIGSITEYTKIVVKDFLYLGTEYSTKINILKLAEKGEVAISNIAIEQCIKTLKSNNLKQRRRALKVINDFIKWGDILPYFQINFKKSTKQIIDQITNPQNKTQGFAALSQYYNNDAEKRLYYNYLLQSIRYWSECYPNVVNCPYKQSYIKLLADAIEKRGFELPKPQAVYIDKGQFLQNNKRKQEINNKLKRKYLFEEFQTQIRKVKNTIKEMEEEEPKIREHHQFFVEFQKDYDIKIVNSYFNESDMDYISTYGSPIIQFVQKVIPFIQNYISGNLSYTNFIKQLSQLKRPLVSSADLRGNYGMDNRNNKDIRSSQAEEESSELLNFMILESKAPKTDRQNLRANDFYYKQTSYGQQNGNCIQTSSPFQSKALFQNKQTNTFKSISDVQNSNETSLYTLKNDICSIKLILKKGNQVSQIKGPSIDPKEHSEYAEDQILKKKSFLEYINADQHEIIPDRRSSSLKLFSPEKSNMLKSSGEKGNRKLVNSKFKELIKINDMTLKSKVFDKSNSRNFQYQQQYANSTELMKMSSNRGTCSGPPSINQPINSNQDMKYKNRTLW